MGIEPSAVARVVGIETIYQDLREGNILFLPQRIAVVGQGSTSSVYDTTKRQVTSAFEVGTTYGFGSPLHLAAMQLFPTNGDGVGTIPVTIYPLEDDLAGVAASGDITPGGAPTEAASYIVRINNIDSEQFVISFGDSVADIVTAMTNAINAVIEMPIIATDSATQVDLATKWKGTNANNIVVEVVGSTTAGNTFAITQPVGGLINPDIQGALNQIGNVWESLILNCLDINDGTALDAYSVFGEGRWGALVKKPLIVFTGNTATTMLDATTVSDARKTDRTNVQLVAPGSKDLFFVVAARELSRIAIVANSNPPRDYGSQPATGLTPGIDGEQWDYITRDAAVKKGSSTIEVKDSVVNLSDTITFYHPSGDPLPAYRFVCDIIKLQNVIFNLDLEFKNTKWDGAPLIPDGDPTVNPDAKKPKNAVSAANVIIDSLALNAILSDPATAKKKTVCTINSQNPKRSDLKVTVQLSGNNNITSFDLNFGYFFGSISPIV